MKICVLWISLVSACLYADLKVPLQDHGGHHFQFEGQKYIITMNVDGKIYFSSKIEHDKDPQSAKKHRIHVRYRSYDKKTDSYKMWEFSELKTKIQQKASSFTLFLEGEMENGVKVKSKLQGDRKKVVMMTDMTCPDPYFFRMGFYIYDTPEDLKSLGKIVKVTKSNDKRIHKCSDIYETKYFKDECKQVLFQKRNPLNLIFSTNKSEGHFVVVQHSHHAGGVLNNPLVVYYKSPSQDWSASKNSIVFSF